MIGSAMLTTELKLKRVPTSQLQLQWLRRFLGDELRRIRAGNDSCCHYLIAHCHDVTRRMRIIADCGLQRDIRKRISEGHLSFNKAWVDMYGEIGDVATRELSEGSEDPIARQLRAVFGNHPVGVFGVTLFRCDAHNSIAFVEALDARQQRNWLFLDERATAIQRVSERLFLAVLREEQSSKAEDWERAVHELASPLDFIYSNSDFLLRYLGSGRISDHQKRMKLEDLRLIADLLINRLHQYRLAFGGPKEIEARLSSQNLYELIKPITHLWYHEAETKRLTFRYDEIRECGEVLTDPDLLRFLLFNLVSNAIKYAHPDTQIEIYGHVTGEEVYSIGVRNVGIPIEGEDRYRIFEPRYRGEEAQRQDARGMGIGLSVCTDIARRLGGRIRLLDCTDDRTVFELEVGPGGRG